MIRPWWFYGGAAVVIVGIVALGFAVDKLRRQVEAMQPARIDAIDTDLEQAQRDLVALYEWIYEQFGPPVNEQPTDEVPAQQGERTEESHAVIVGGARIVDTGPPTQQGLEYRDVNIGGEVRRFLIG